MNLITLKYFIAVADAQNFSKAANENHISQTAISQQIARLEKELNVKLFIRTIPIELTPAGKRVYRRAKIIIDQYDMIKEDIEEVKKEKYIYRVAYSSLFRTPLEQIVLPSLINLTSVQFTLNQVQSDKMQGLLEEKMMDLVVCYESDITNDADINLIPFKKGNYDIVLSNAKFDKSLIENPNHFFKNTTLFYVTEVNYSNSFDNLLNMLRKQHTVFKHIKFVPDMESALMMVSLNQGILLVPDFISISSSLKLTRIPYKNQSFTYQLCLAYPRNNKMVKKIIPKLKVQL